MIKRNTMKILSVWGGLPPYNAAWIRISKIADILVNVGHDVEFVFYMKKPKEEPIINIPFNYSIVYASVFTIHIKHFLKLKNGDYDIVYCNTHLTPFISLLTKLTKIPLILDRHGDTVQEFLLEQKFSLNPTFLLNYFYKKIIETIDLKISDKIICVSHKMIEDLTKKGIPKKKLTYLTNGVDLNFFKQANTEKNEIIGINTEKMIFGYIGAFDKWQGIKSFIETSKKIKNKNILFIMVGGEKKFK